MNVGERWARSFQEEAQTDSVFLENAHWVKVLMGIMLSFNVNLPQIRTTWAESLTWRRLLTALIDVGKHTRNVRGPSGSSPDTMSVAEGRLHSSYSLGSSLLLPRILSWHESQCFQASGCSSPGTFKDFGVSFRPVVAHSFVGQATTGLPASPVRDSHCGTAPTHQASRLKDWVTMGVWASQM